MSLSSLSFKSFFKKIASLPPEYENISVETALNSRCSSDNDGDPKNFHWGIFDNSKKLSYKHISIILKATNIPRFINKALKVHNKKNFLTFTIDRKAKGIEREWLMVESGMQQQAVFLTCAALGIGVQIHNMGKDGSPINKEEYGTIQAELKPMKPSFNGSYWSKLPPLGERPWRTGNLPDPDRDSGKPLMSVISNLKTSNKGPKKVTRKIVGQLLWAARGRTPHYYMSKPWGLTIPTWAGEQGISSVYLLSKEGTFIYINWEDDHPTHTFKKINNKSISITDIHNILKINPLPSYAIALGKNEKFARALWEIGYQLENLILQASSLNISFKTILLDKKQKNAFLNLGIKEVIGLFCIF